MERIETYKKIIYQELSKRANIRIANAPKLFRRLIIDKEQAEFVLMDIG